jgi:hypothetical protein
MVHKIKDETINYFCLFYLFVLSQFFNSYKLISPLKKLIKNYNQSDFIVNVKKLGLGAGRTIGSSLSLFKLVILLLNTLKTNSPESNIDFTLERRYSFFEVRLKDNNTYSRFTKLLSSDKKDFLKRFIIPIERTKLISGDYDIISHRDHKRELIVKVPVIYI